MGEAGAESRRDDQPTKQVKVGIGRNHDVEAARRASGVHETGRTMRRCRGRLGPRANHDGRDRAAHPRVWAGSGSRRRVDAARAPKAGFVHTAVTACCFVHGPGVLGDARALAKAGWEMETVPPAAQGGPCYRLASAGCDHGLGRLLSLRDDARPHAWCG